MRIRITLLPTSYPAWLPVNHHPLAAFIYETVAFVAPQLAGLLHDEGLPPGLAEETDRRFKPFVFAVPELPPYSFQAAQKVFEQGLVYWQISSPLPEFIEALVAGLATQESVRIGRTRFSVVNLEILPPPHLTRQMRFIALSPLTMAVTERGDEGRRIKHYLRADEPAFGPLVAENLREKYRALTGQEPVDTELDFEFDQDYLRRAGGVESRKVSRLITYKETKIKGYQMPFVVSGAPELIALGWECGFGNANSQGFGMAGLG